MNNLSLSLEDSPILNRSSRRLTTPSAVVNVTFNANAEEEKNESITETPTYDNEEGTAEDEKNIQTVLRLTAEKKINSKNAFHLRFVDTLEKMYNRSDESNLDEYYKALDAGVTIYSCQIDNLYEETMSVVRELDELRVNRKKHNTEKEEPEDEGEKKGKPRKRKHKPVLLEDPNSVCRNNIGDEIKQKMTLLRDSLKLKQETGSEHFLNPYTLTYELEGSLNLCSSLKVDESCYKKVDISKFDFYEGKEITILPEFDLSFDTVITTPPSTIYKVQLDAADYEDIEEWSEAEEDLNKMEEAVEDLNKTEESVEDLNNMEEAVEDVNEMEEAVEDVNEMDEAVEDLNEMEESVEGFDGDVETIEREQLENDGSPFVPVDIEDEFEQLSIKENASKFSNTNQLSSLVVSKQSEYSYFEEPVLRKWFEDTKTSTNQWNPFRNKDPVSLDETEVKKGRKKKEKEKKKVDYNNIEILDEFYQKKKYVRKGKMEDFKMWHQFEEIFLFDDRRFITFCTWRQEMDVVLSPEETVGELDEKTETFMDDNDDGEFPDDMSDSILQFEEAEIDENEGEFYGDNLVEAPKKVDIMNMTVEKRAFMDIMKLKTQIWEVLEKRVESGESVPFSWVGIKLRNFDFPVLFNALLHLANEKRLNIEGQPELYISLIPPKKK